MAKRARHPINTELRGAIGHSGLQHQEVAKRALMTPVRLSQVITGARRATREEKDNLARVLSRSVSALFLKDDPPG